MDLVYVSRIPNPSRNKKLINGDEINPELKIEKPTQDAVEEAVAEKVSLFAHDAERARTKGYIFNLVATTLCALTILAFPIGIIGMLAVYGLYVKFTDFEYNPIGHRRFSLRMQKAWQTELDRISNYDSRIPYKNLPPST